MISLWWLDIIGWIGFVGLGLFYWLLGSGKVIAAYTFGIVGAIAWLIIGIITEMGYAAKLPSLVVMEIMVILMNIRGIYKWKKKEKES